MMSEIRYSAGCVGDRSIRVGRCDGGVRMDVQYVVVGDDNYDETAKVTLAQDEAVRLAVALIQATEGERLDHLVEVIGGNRNVLHVSLGEDDRDAKIRAGLALIRAAGGK